MLFIILFSLFSSKNRRAEQVPLRAESWLQWAGEVLGKGG
jgi:hypothetical protein